jgi:hypothetical protein
MSQLAAYAETPEEQKMSFVIKPEPGSMFSAADVGEMLKCMSDILTAPDTTIPKGHKMLCALAGVDMTPEGKITFHLLLTLQATKKPSPDRQP